ncbi:NAD(P)H-dependent oxidoreductase [Chryseobacterium sp. 09-1422]|uniref:NAD(P)H-dependent oxidoreductase n=1 Tax=Chryseobacterium kimseyorum TaxID=2984028 RepID=A0ABT3I268_9FLAO|nr:NAD(P)H-dependent oxidoreductase [Chryseobacterium kimseyorum]MCW3170149.1 NAD(P)H-dependent oxidoreductase [Chryseobacterium kimseyorum]
MKTLVIVTHPTMDESLINKRWVEELNKFPEKYVVHELYKAYPDEILDIKKEQELVEAYDKIIFQFPFYWFGSPSLLKKWFDEVLLHGWAYGSKSGYKVSGKKVALAISAGVDDKDFRADGKYRHTVIEFTRPFELSFEYIRADYHKPFVYYGLEHNVYKEWIERSVPMYLEFIDNL